MPVTRNMTRVGSMQMTVRRVVDPSTGEAQIALLIEGDLVDENGVAREHFGPVERLKMLTPKQQQAMTEALVDAEMLIKVGSGMEKPTPEVRERVEQWEAEQPVVLDVPDQEVVVISDPRTIPEPLTAEEAEERMRLRQERREMRETRETRVPRLPGRRTE